jgi:hypothetical protein
MAKAVLFEFTGRVNYDNNQIKGMLLSHYRNGDMVGYKLQ